MTTADDKRLVTFTADQWLDMRKHQKKFDDLIDASAPDEEIRAAYEAFVARVSGKHYVIEQEV